MIRPTFIFLFVFLFATSISDAQTITAKLELGRKDAIPDYVEYCRADKGIITVGNASRKSSRNVALVKYDEAFTRLWSKMILERNGRNNVDFITPLGETVLVFTSEYFPKIRSVRTYVQPFDLSDGTVGTQQMISELSNEPSHRVELKFRTSINKKRLLAYKNLNNAQQHEEIIYFVFDESGAITGEGKIELPLPDEKFTVRSIEVGNNGNIFLLGKHYKVNKIKNPDDFEYLLYKVNSETGTMEELVVSFGGLYLTDLTMKIDRLESVYLAGFYSEVSTSQIVGTLFVKVDENLQISRLAPQKFSEDFLALFLRDKQIEKGKELKNFYLDDIVLRSDGGLLLLGEKFYVTYSSYRDLQGFWIDQKNYHYDEIIINSVDADGNLEWSSVVRKYQSGMDQSNLSYHSMVSGESLYLMYDYQQPRMPNSIYYNSVSMEGEVSETKPFLKKPSGNDTFYPGSCEQISNTESLVAWQTMKDRIVVIAKIEFD